MFYSQGEEWYNLRTKVNPVLMNPNVQYLYVPKLNSVADQFISRMRHFAKSDVNSEMPDDFIVELNKWALEGIGVVALDRRLGCLDAAEHEEGKKIIETTLELFKLIYILDYTPNLWLFFNSKNWNRFVEKNDYLVGLISKYIDEAIEEINSRQSNEKERSILESLLKVDKQMAFVMVGDMFFAGVDTVRIF